MTASITVTKGQNGGWQRVSARCAAAGGRQAGPCGVWGLPTKGTSGRLGLVGVWEVFTARCSQGTVPAQDKLFCQGVVLTFA